MAAATGMNTTTTAAAASSSFEEYSPAFKSLVDYYLRTISHLNHALAVLNYDQQVFMLQSDKSSMARGKQLATLASIAHDKSTDPQIGQWIIHAMQDLAKLNEQQQQQQQQQQQEEDSSSSCVAAAVVDEKELVTAKRLLELEKESYQKQICIPTELAAWKAELEASANHAWVKVRFCTMM